MTFKQLEHDAEKQRGNILASLTPDQAPSPAEEVPVQLIPAEAPISGLERDMIGLNFRVGVIGVISCLSGDKSSFTAPTREESNWMSVAEPDPAEFYGALKVVTHIAEDEIADGRLIIVDLLGMRYLSGNRLDDQRHLARFDLHNRSISVLRESRSRQRLELITEGNQQKNMPIARAKVDLIEKYFGSEAQPVLRITRPQLRQ